MEFFQKVSAVIELTRSMSVQRNYSGDLVHLPRSYCNHMTITVEVYFRVSFRGFIRDKGIFSRRESFEERAVLGEKRSFGAGMLCRLHSVPLALKSDRQYFNQAPTVFLAILVTRWKIFTKISLAAICSVHVSNRVRIGLHRFCARKASKVILIGSRSGRNFHISITQSWRPTTLEICEVKE